MIPEAIDHDKLWLLSENEIMGQGLFHMQSDEAENILKKALSKLGETGVMPSMTVDGSSGKICINDGSGQLVWSGDTGTAVQNDPYWAQAPLTASKINTGYISAMKANVASISEVDDLRHEVEHLRDRVHSLERDNYDQDQRINALESMLNTVMSDFYTMKEQFDDMMAGKEYTPLSRDDAAFRDLLDNMEGN